MKYKKNYNFIITFTEAVMENSKPIIELELYIIRHGESHGNAGYGREDLTMKEANDPYLTEKGIAQAQAAGLRMAEINFDAFYSSALLRAVQTASEIMKKQSAEKTLNVHPLLTEVGIIPEYEGAGMDEICEICPTAVLADGVSESDPLVYHSNFDNEGEMFERAEKIITHLRNRYKNGERVAVVSHAAFMTFIVFWIMGFRNAVPAFDISFKNTGVTRVIFYKEGTNKYGDIVFEYINDTTHYKLM